MHQIKRPWGPTGSHVTHPSPDFLDLQAALAGEYSSERELGRGGMGIVYLAREVQLDRAVAIKVLPAQLSLTPAARERFIREARMTPRVLASAGTPSSLGGRHRGSP